MKKRILPIVAAIFMLAAPAYIVSCGDDDDETEQNDPNENGEPNNSNPSQPVSVNDEDTYLRFVITSDGEVEVAGFKASFNGYEVNPTTFKAISIPNEVVIKGKPYTVTTIGESAFAGCSSLASVDLPSGITSLGVSAFENCYSLTSIALPSGITSFGDDAFKGCKSLTSIKIPESVTSLGDNAFAGCSSLASVDLPGGITSLGDWAFYGCSSLTSIDLPGSVESIGKSAFENCISLEIKIPANIEIGARAFYFCKNAYTGKLGEYTYVDLGLPSGTKWATYNVGATKPTEYGDYFAWGETKPKAEYSWETYKWCNGSSRSITKYCTYSEYGTVDNKTVLEAEDDAATANWGSAWRMPTREEIKELLDGCSWKTVEDFNGSGVNGQLGTSKKNGATIFLPAAGRRYDTNLDDAGSHGYYWSSSLYELSPSTAYNPGSAYNLYFYFYNSDIYCMNDRRYRGQRVRAVLR